MAKTEDKSEKEKIKFLKSWKILDDKTTLYLTHDNGVDSYEIDSISEIEIDYLKSPSVRFFEDFMSIGLVSVIIISIIAAIFNIDPNKNYFEELWLFFPLGIICVYFGIYILSDSVFTFLLHQNHIIGRKLILYSTVQGKKEYNIGSWDYENVMTNDFFKILLMKSTGINNLLKKDTKSFNDSIREIVDYQYRTWELYPIEEYFKFLFISIISIIFYTIWFINVPHKLELIPLCGANLILLIIEIVEIIKTKKSIKWQKNLEREKNQAWQHYYYFRLFDNADDVDTRKNEELIYLGSLKDIEMSQEYLNIGITFITENKEPTIYFENSKEFYNKLNLITTYGLWYYLNQQKETDKIIYIFKKS